MYERKYDEVHCNKLSLEHLFGIFLTQTWYWMLRKLPFLSLSNSMYTCIRTILSRPLKQPWNVRYDDTVNKYLERVIFQHYIYDLSLKSGERLRRNIFKDFSFGCYGNRYFCVEWFEFIPVCLWKTECIYAILMRSQLNNVFAKFSKF